MHTFSRWYRFSSEHNPSHSHWPSTLIRQTHPHGSEQHSIRTHGKHSLTLNLGLRRLLPWIFIIADVQKPILGADSYETLDCWLTCRNNGWLTHTVPLANSTDPLLWHLHWYMTWPQPPRITHRNSSIPHNFSTISIASSLLTSIQNSQSSQNTPQSRSHSSPSHD